MSGFNTHPLRYIRFVHRPYKRPDKYSIATPRQRFDHTRVYRVLTEDGSGTIIDISTPVPRVIDRVPVMQSVMPLFYVGAESDLDRYLRWLHNVALLDDDNRPRTINVIEQMVSDFEEEREHLSKRDSAVMMLFPGQMDELMVLTDANKGRAKKLAIY